MKNLIKFLVVLDLVMIPIICLNTVHLINRIERDINDSIRTEIIKEQSNRLVDSINDSDKIMRKEMFMN